MVYDACYFCKKNCVKSNVSVWCSLFEVDSRKDTSADSLYSMDEDNYE